MKNALLAGMLAVLLGACASGVNLDTPPVEDRTGAAAARPAEPASAASPGTGQGSGVTGRPEDGRSGQDGSGGQSSGLL